MNFYYIIKVYSELFEKYRKLTICFSLRKVTLKLMFQLKFCIMYTKKHKQRLIFEK